MVTVYYIFLAEILFHKVVSIVIFEYFYDM